MIRLTRSDAVPAVVDDQHGQPTWSVDVARQISALISGGPPAGIYHATSSGQTTWFGPATEVIGHWRDALHSAFPALLDSYNWEACHAR